MWAHVFDAVVPLHKVFQHMQNTIAKHHQGKGKSPGTISSTARGFWDTPDHARTRRARILFSAAEAPFIRKTQCFLQILTFKWHPWCIRTKLSCEASVKLQELRYENEAFVRCFRQISRIRRCENVACVLCFLLFAKDDDVKTKLLCDISFKLQCSILFYSALLYSSLL